MWLISGDTKDTVMYCYITVIAELIKKITIHTTVERGCTVLYKYIYI